MVSWTKPEQAWSSLEQGYELQRKHAVQREERGRFILALFLPSSKVPSRGDALSPFMEQVQDGLVLFKVMNNCRSGRVFS